MIYFISDTHFCQKSIIPYCHRPFGSVDEMNEKLIENWNSVVKKDDKVYFLGDFCLGDLSEKRDILNRLNGYKIIVKGNHEDEINVQSLMNLGWDEAYVCPTELMYVDKDKKVQSILLSHQPQYISDNQFNIHGHIHDTLLENEYPDMNPNNHLCVSVEVIDYRPISFEEIQKEYLEKFFNKRKED